MELETDNAERSSCLIKRLPGDRTSEIVHEGPSQIHVSLPRPLMDSSSICRNNDRDGGEYAGHQSARWERVDGKFVCTAQITRQPNIRERPRFIDVTIEDSGRQRVWF